MKNLKKFGAVALAAVMAVTFAPVASMNVFAANNVGVDADNEYLITATDTVTLNKGGKYSIKTGVATTSSTTLEIAAGGDYTIDIGEHAIGAVTIDAVGAKVTIEASDTTGDGDTTIGTIASITFATPSTTAQNISSLTLNGGKVTGTITDNYGNLTINGGYVVGNITFSDGAAHSGTGSSAKPTTVASSSFTVTGGNFAGTITDSATYLAGKKADGTTAMTESDIVEKGNNNDILTAASITGGVFKNDPSTLVWCGSNDSKKMETPMIASSTAIAKLENAYTLKVDGTTASAAYVVGNDTINAKIAGADGSKNASTTDVEVVSGAVALKDVRDGVTAVCVSNTTGTNDGKSLTVAPKSGYSVYHETKTDKTSATYMTVTDKYFVGDDAIAGTTGALMSGSALKKVGWDHDNTVSTTSYAGTFTNGGKTLEVDINGDKYVVDEAKINTMTQNLNVKTVNVDCVNDTNKDVTFTDAQSVTKFTADKKYSILTGTDDSTSKAIVEVTKSPKCTAGSVGNGIKGDDVNVEQVGASEIGAGAHGILIVDMGSASGTVKSVTTMDKTLPLSYATAGGEVLYFVGDNSNQVAAGSSTGYGIISAYAVAKDTTITTGDALTANSTLTFVQGGVTLPGVAAKNGGAGSVENIDSTATNIDFQGADNIAITKKVNYTTNGFGVKQVSSVDVIVGVGSSVPTTLRRFVNPSTGEHFYTNDTVEIASIKAQGFTEETSNIKVLGKDATTGVAVYRIVNNTNGRHVYTTSKHEYDTVSKWAGFTGEGVKFHAASTGTIPVYRLLNETNGDHLYTGSAHENSVVKTWPGWKYEEISFYSVD